MSYQVVPLRPLLSGGSGDLSIGKRTDTGELVVIKYLRECHLPEARKGFAREVRILARNLPGLMRILCANTEAAHPYYVMPYLDGGSLSKYAGKLNEHQLLAIATAVAGSLVALHAQYISHGDVKPDNIMVSHDGRMHVADPLGSGIGCTVLFSENRGGTPGYWAPEVHAGRPISHAGDVYSYGTTLYHLLTGLKPQDGQRLDLSVQNYPCAPKIRQVIIACCHTDPHERASMQEVLRMLGGEQWADIQTMRRQHQKQMTTVCVIGVLVLLVAALAG
ncbi:MAG: serine/threonine-protein kinase [Halobacteriota archaeon]|jgi:serine/threonine protein kinase